MPNSRNFCFHGSGHIIRKGGQELGLHRPWNMFPQTQSNYPHHARSSFVWKGFCTNTNKSHFTWVRWRRLSSLAWTVFASEITRSPQKSIAPWHEWSLKKKSSSNKKILFEEENPSSLNKKMLLNKMASLVFLVLGSLAQRVKIPDLPSCEGLDLFSNCCKSLICFRFFRVAAPWFIKKSLFF